MGQTQMSLRAACWVIASILFGGLIDSGCVAKKNSSGLLAESDATACKVSYQKYDDWGSGAVYRVKIENQSVAVKNGWHLTVRFGGGEKISDSPWGGTYQQNGQTVEVDPVDWSRDLRPGQFVEIGFIVRYEVGPPRIDTIVLSGGGCAAQVSSTDGQKPTPAGNGTTPTNSAAHDSFYIDSAKLYDATGKEFIMRGVVVPFAYFKDKSIAVIQRIRELGFNTVRIIWCADNLNRSGRCDNRDVHPVSELAGILDTLRQNKIVAVLNLQNASGSDSVDDLKKMVDYLLHDDVKTVLETYKKYLIINIANEWYGTWDHSRTYVDAYKTEISRLRSAGLKHVFIIDARGWGQDPSSIPENGEELIKSDGNIMLSAHMYDVYSEAQIVKDAFSFVTNHRIPFIVGEFACQHYPYQPRVACDAIFAEAGNGNFGYIAWSISGNDSPIEGLDVLEAANWYNLTSWGTRLIDGPGGIKSSSHEAAIFSVAP